VKVFVAGATGVIGRRLVPMLVEEGHDVVGMTRSQERSGVLREAGAEPVVCDVFDLDRLRESVLAAAPEVVVHQLTDLPAAIDPRRVSEQMVGNDRVRTEGTANLVSAARAAGARRVVAQSIAFAYAPVGGPAKEEEDPLFLDAPEPWSRSVRAVDELERTVTGTEGIEGVVLRYGFFYGPGSSYASDGSLAREVRRRRLPIVGRGGGIFSFVHVDDAAGASVLALKRGSPNVYNVVDDDPAPQREWLPRYAQALGAKKPFRVPKLLARLVAGQYAVMLATELRGASNARAKRELGWSPRYPSWRDGFAASLAVGEPA
jgi:nucleoside-diphosphate-sugar epimerase